MSQHHDFAARPSHTRAVHRDDTVTITGAEYLRTRRRQREAELLLSQAVPYLRAEDERTKGIGWLVLANAEHFLSESSRRSEAE